MKEIACYILPVIITFCLIGMIESAMLFEETEEQMEALYLKDARKENHYGNIKSRKFM